MDLEEELITTEEFERFRKNYLLKIREIEKQIITKQNIVEELKNKLSDKGSFVSDIVPEKEDTLNRLSLVSFIDRIEIGEDNAINFVFNNFETISLMQAILDNENQKDSKENTNKTRIFTIGRAYGEALEKNMPRVAVGGVC